jgi:NAD(P)-dependent dehydrogenase (short-subunit alcohol dehydrogenase family)
MGRFEGKAGIITGGGTGIGRSIAEGIVSDGGKVLVVGRREEPLKELASKYDGTVAYMQGDLSDSGIATEIVERAVLEFGQVDFVVNNAAAAEVLPFALTSDEAIDAHLAVNIKGVLTLTREAVGELEKTKGAVVNISSVAGQTAVPGFALYAATKSAGDRLTKVLANELGPQGIRVNSVAPGLTRTEMFDRTMGDQPEAVEMLMQQTALRRSAHPDEVARTVLWLLSEDAGWITGQIIQSSGGLMLA